jgi:beta-glucosidase
VDGLWRTLPVERLGIPAFAMSDGPRGVTAAPSTTFPVATMRGATFDPELERRVGEVMALELRAHGGNVLLAPAINVLRHPGWGRAQETYGEDPHHLGVMGAAMVEGIQQHALASVKHFAANSIEDTRFEVDVTLSEAVLREVYTPHFRRVVQEARVASVMSAYNLVNGEYCAENADLLGLLEEWGFDGFVESDWVFGTRSTVPTALAGLDLEMPAAQWFGEPLLEAVVAGDVPEEVVDEAVRDQLRQKLRFGLADLPPVEASVVESAEHVALAREVARDGMVLLRNEGGALPLRAGARVAVVGALAGVANLGDTGSSAAFPTSAVSPLAGLAERYDAVAFETDAPDAAALADIGAADAAVVVVGLTAEDEGEHLFLSGGDRDTLALHPEHEALIRAVAAAQPRTIVVVEGGATITMAGWLDAPEAVLFAFYPGMEGGRALADVLTGDVAPSGRLPFVIPADEADLPAFDHVGTEVTYDAWHGQRKLDRDGVRALFPFGFGLTYGEVVIEGLTAASTSVAADGELEVTVTLHNPGDRALREVVQLYVGAPGPDRPERVLAAFRKVEVPAGGHVDVALSAPVADLARWDGGWVVEPGPYRLEVGPDAGHLTRSATIEVR